LHDGAYDVEMTYEIFKKQLFDIEIWILSNTKNM
jgi:hypothetical protein